MDEVFLAATGLADLVGIDGTVTEAFSTEFTENGPVWQVSWFHNQVPCVQRFDWASLKAARFNDVTGCYELVSITSECMMVKLLWVHDMLEDIEWLRSVTTKTQYNPAAVTETEKLKLRDIVEAMMPE